MKLSQLVESFVISNDEFEDYLNRATEQLAQELQSGKNARDAIHDLSLTFADQHNKAYDAYVRMQDALTARMHTLELDNASSAPEMGMEPEMGAPEMDADPEMMTDPMGDMEMDTPADSEMPSDSDMEDYAAVMDNEPEAEVEESVNEASCGCCGNDPCDCDDSCDCKKVNEAEEKPYICVHAKKGKHECHASSSYEAAKKAAAHWKMKSTAGIDAHLAVEESTLSEHDMSLLVDVIKQMNKDASAGDYTAIDELLKDIPAEKLEAFLSQLDEDLAGKLGKYKAEISVSESMEVINKIVADKQAGKINGMKVDMFTASAIKQVYDAVNDDNKAKLDDLMKTKEGVLKVANIAMKMLGEAERTDEVLPAVAGAVGKALVSKGIKGAASRAVAATAVNKTVGEDRAHQGDDAALIGVGKVKPGTVVKGKDGDDYEFKGAQYVNKRTGRMASIQQRKDNNLRNKKLNITKGQAKTAGAAAVAGAKAGGSAIAKMASGVVHAASDGQLGKAFKKEDVDTFANSIMASSIDMSEKALPAALNQAHKDGKKKGDKIKIGDQEITLKSDPKPFHKMTDADLQKLDALEQRLNEKGCSSRMKK